MKAARGASRGGALPLVAIIAVAACLRTAVASLAPIADDVNDALQVSPLDYSVLSTVPLLCFAVAGFLTPGLVRRRGLVTATLVALASMLVGTAGRGVVGAFEPFLVLSLLIYLGIGVGNVVLAPLVKRYFPHRVQLVTTAYFTVMSMSTFIPPLLSAPLADLSSWRWSVSSWALLVVIALVPVVMLRARSDAGDDESGSSVHQVGRGAPAKDVRAWALAMLFGVSMFNVYVYFAWLPQILVDLVGWSEGQASLLLAVYASLGLPLALVVPSLAARMRRPALLAVVAGVLTILGNAGLLVGSLPSAWVWLCVCVAGMCPLLYPLGVTMLVLFSADEHEAASLGGFAQGMGYTVGAAGPLAAGLLSEASGSWGWTLVMLSASGTVAVLAGALLVALPTRAGTDPGRARGAQPFGP